MGDRRLTLMPLIDDETDDGEIQNSSVPTQQKSVKENGLPAKLDWLNDNQLIESLPMLKTRAS